eukprot:5257-Prorocentrum_minimum.AAC.1
MCSSLGPMCLWLLWVRVLQAMVEISSLGYQVGLELTPIRYAWLCHQKSTSHAPPVMVPGRPAIKGSVQPGGSNKVFLFLSTRGAPIDIPVKFKVASQSPHLCVENERQSVEVLQRVSPELIGCWMIKYEFNS